MLMVQSLEKALRPSEKASRPSEALCTVDQSMMLCSTVQVFLQGGPLARRPQEIAMLVASNPTALWQSLQRQIHTHPTVGSPYINTHPTACVFCTKGKQV
jgi:hypothetical protein